MHRWTVAPMAAATVAASAHAACGPAARRRAAASAARSAAAWARCRDSTAGEAQRQPRVTLIRATITNAATTVATPESSPIRLGRRDRLPRDDKAGEQRGAAADSGQEVIPFASHLQ